MVSLREICNTTASNAVLEKIMNQFKDGENIVVDITLVIEMPKSRLFNELVKNKGKGKPHSLKNYVRREGKKKNS